MVGAGWARSWVPGGPDGGCQVAQVVGVKECFAGDGIGALLGSKGHRSNTREANKRSCALCNDSNCSMQKWGRDEREKRRQIDRLTD